MATLHATVHAGFATLQLEKHLILQFLDFKVGHPVVFQDNNYVVTVDTAKYIT